MSTTDPVEDNGDQYNERDRAVRLFAAELEDAAGHYFTENPNSDNSPNYTLLPTGVRANRVLVIGTLIETTEYEDSGFIYGRVNDGDSNFDINVSSEYQPRVAGVIQDIEPPELVAVVGKLNHYTDGEDNERVEIQQLDEVTPVSPEDRNEWVFATAVRLRERVKDFRETTQEEIDSGEAPEDIELVHDDPDKSDYAYESVDLDGYLDAAIQAVESTMSTETDSGA